MYYFCSMLSADTYRTLEGPGIGEFRDRGSKFIGYAFPVQTEDEALSCIEAVRKEHLKARHHCFAWRIGIEGQRFRAYDDGEPSGTAGKPILGQIDAAGLTNVAVVVVRYFGGTLLGTSGLIRAYRQSAAEALRQAPHVERTILAQIEVEVVYALLPEWQHSAKRSGLPMQVNYGADAAILLIGIPRSQVEVFLRQQKALLWRAKLEEADALPWPEGVLRVKQLP